jgi:hypothetical protein
MTILLSSAKTRFWLALVGGLIGLSFLIGQAAAAIGTSM